MSLEFVDAKPSQPTNAVVIWLHGLGDSGHGFAPIASQLPIDSKHNIHFIFPHAPERPVTINNGFVMRAWYDIKSLELDRRADEEGVIESAQQVEALIQQQIDAGIPANRIILAGFSQGGVVALHLGLRFGQRLAGILAMSTYMCSPENLKEQASDANRLVPIMQCHGTDDEMVPLFMGEKAKSTLQENNYTVDWRTYPMQHNVCPQQVGDIAQWINSVLD